MPYIGNKFENFAARQTQRQGLYCVWIRAQETQGAPMIAVWIDPRMRGMEEGASDAEPIVSPALTVGSEDAVDEDRPGSLGMALCRVPSPTAAFTCQQQLAGRLGGLPMNNDCWQPRGRRNRGPNSPFDPDNRDTSTRGGLRNRASLRHPNAAEFMRVL
jgi:hypothetical protein